MTSLALIEEHRTVLSDIGSIASLEVAQIMASAKNLEFEDWRRLMSRQILATKNVYSSLSGLTAQEFYKLSRRDANIKGRYQGVQVPVIGGPTDDLFLAGFNATLDLYKSGAAYDRVEKQMKEVITKAVFNQSRATVEKNGSYDVMFVKPMVISRARSCAFCKYMSLVTDILSYVPTRFHESCHCVVAGYFKKERKFIQEEQSIFNERVKTVSRDLLDADEVPNEKNILRMMRKEFGYN